MRTLVAVLLLFCAFQSVHSVPWHIPPQSPTPYDQSVQFHPGPHARSPAHQLKQLSNIIIPTCALSCYLNALVVDGCAQEVDLRCHCSRGDVLRKTKSCVEEACDEQDQDEATQKVVDACRVVGINPQLPPPAVSSTSRPTPSSTTPVPMAETTTPTMTTTMSTTSKRSPALSTSTTMSSEAVTTSQVYSTNTTSTLPSPSETTSTTPTPSAVPPLPPVPPPATSLSPGAKAGISVSTILVATTICLSISLYIRRLKRQLASARAAAADVPDSVLRSPSRHTIIPDAMLAPARRQSWPSRPGSRRLSKRDIPYTAGSPVSPISPVFVRESGSGVRASLASVLGKQRGNVLSVVVERDDEDASSLVARGNVNEPVAGQSEGLVDPLELDAGLTVQIFEAPISITPRARSAEMERDELKGFDFGETRGRDVL